MAGGINIAFAADASAFLRGAGDVETALDDVQDALDTVAQDADKAGRDIADGLERAGDGAKDVGRDIEKHIEDGTKDAGQSVEKLERKFRDLRDTAETSVKGAGDSIDRDFRRGTDGASEGMENLKDESKETARESAASFDGSADSILDAFQEVAANAFTGFGPAGLVAGLGIAAGIGIGMAALQATADEAAETKQKIIDLADGIREAGGNIQDIDWGERFREFGNEIADAKSWFEPWQDAAVTNFEAASKAAERFGLSYQDVLQGMAGDTDAGKRALEDVNAEIARSEAKVREMEGAVDAQSRAQRDLRAEERMRIGDLKDLQGKIQDGIGLTEEAIEYEKMAEEAYRDSAAGIAEHNEQLREKAELTADAIGSELDWLDTLESSTAKLQENASAGWDKNTAAGRENLRALAEISDGALSYADAIQEAGGSQADANGTILAGRDAVVRAGEALGMTKAQAEQYADSLGLIPRTVSTTAEAKTATAEQALYDTARARTAPFVAQAYTADADAALDRVASRTRTATIRGRLVMEAV